jgi:hypothetical protein
MAWQRQSLMVAIILRVILLKSFEHVPKDANIVAHELAREARRYQPSVYHPDFAHTFFTRCDLSMQ